MYVDIFPVGTLLTCCYIANCVETKEAIIIDPGTYSDDDARSIFRYIKKKKLEVKGIVNTHGHQDHINGDRVMQKKYAVPVYIHEHDAYFLSNLEKQDVSTDVLLKDGDTITFGKVCLKVMHTPGHTMGSICLIGEECIFSGDTLFIECIGRTDFAESSPKDMEASLRKLIALPDNLIVYPGHEEPTSIGHEKHNNPFLVDLAK